MTGQPIAPPPAASDSGRIVRIVALVFIGLVVLCGICGTCLFAVTLVAPLFTGTATPAP